MDKLTVPESDAEKIWKWLHEREGLAIWRSVDLSDPSASWTTPVLNDQGQKSTKPSWKADNNPDRIVTDPNEVQVTIPKEMRRFRVAVRMGSGGLSLKVTDAGTRKIRLAVIRANEVTGKPSWYTFDYYTQEAVIMVDDVLIPLPEYAQSKGWS